MSHRERAQCAYKSHTAQASSWTQNHTGPSENSAEVENPTSQAVLMAMVREVTCKL